MSTPDWKKVAKKRLDRIRELESQQRDFAERAGEIAEKQLSQALHALCIGPPTGEVKQRLDAACAAIHDAAVRRFKP